MIQVKALSKNYGGHPAIADLSFSIEKGRIYGFLGPNGAGKSTTMNIMTGCLAATSGQVLIDGHDILEDSVAAKRCIGYLPEKPPLYDEMTVRAYLKFVCELKEVDRKAIAAHIGEIMATCGLTDVADRLVGHLSKGFRQRVGVAQALCGNPPVIVLDEPTVGLDPKQVVEIRGLMRELGKNHTVLFSSHLLSEIQQLCQRVIILHKGRLIREADMADLTGDGETIRLRASIAMKESLLQPALKGLACVRRVKVLPTADANVTEVELECLRDGGERGDPQTQLFRLLCGLDAPLRMLVQKRDTLEEVFLKATAEGE